MRRKSYKLRLLNITFTPSKTLGRARSLRRNQTEAEKKLWGYLRNSSLNGFKFTRQTLVGIAEFLESCGYCVFRCYNADVFENIDGVLDGILLQLEES